MKLGKARGMTSVPTDDKRTLSAEKVLGLLLEWHQSGVCCEKPEVLLGDIVDKAWKHHDEHMVKTIGKE